MDAILTYAAATAPGSEWTPEPSAAAGRNLLSTCIRATLRTRSGASGSSSTPGCSGKDLPPNTSSQHQAAALLAQTALDHQLLRLHWISLHIQRDSLYYLKATAHGALVTASPGAQVERRPGRCDAGLLQHLAALVTGDAAPPPRRTVAKLPHLACMVQRPGSQPLTLAPCRRASTPTSPISTWTWLLTSTSSRLHPATP
jgi:hypothetical protein